MATKTVRAANPYSNRRTRPGEAPGVQTGTAVYYSKYAVPDIPETTDPEYVTGHATEFDPDYQSGVTPDKIRIGAVEPPLNDPNNRRYNQRRTRDFFARINAADETVTQNWDVKQQRTPPGQNPLWVDDRPPTRPTADNAPMPYMFSRYWHVPRFLGSIDPSLEDHISMADHRREFQIMGMRTRDRVGVNTFRLDPVPWDQGLYPPDQTVPPEPNSSAARLGNRSFRLG